jgi:hypothetical protein
MKRSLIGLAVVGLLFAGVANAEVRKGDVLLDFLGGWTLQNFSDDVGGGDINIFFAAARPGVALTDNIRVAGVGAVVVANSDIADITVWAIGGSAQYVFMPANQMNLYIGAQVAYASADLDIGGDVDGLLWGPQVGILYTLNTTNNLFVEYQYQIWSGDIHDVLEDGHMVLLGIEHKFKVGQ